MIERLGIRKLGGGMIRKIRVLLIFFGVFIEIFIIRYVILLGVKVFGFSI